jgi:hypothetical protein
LTGVLVVAVAGAVAGFAAGTNVQTLHVRTDRGHTAILDLGAKGKTPGDVYLVSGNVFTPDGRRLIGRVRGTQTDIKLEKGTETVQAMLTYQFGAGNEIIIGGLGAYPLKSTGLVRGKPFVRAVLGGTGKYAGAKGTVTTTQLSNGDYDHVFKLTY